MPMNAAQNDVAVRSQVNGHRECRTKTLYIIPLLPRAEFATLFVILTTIRFRCLWENKRDDIESEVLNVCIRRYVRF